METGKTKKLFIILLTILFIGGICGTADGQSSEVITFSEFPLGTYITTQYSNRGIIFGGDNPFITGDGANPTSPVLSGEPRFEGAIEGMFVNPSDGITPITVSSFSLDAGHFDDIESTLIEWFDKNDDKIGEQSNSSYGIEHFDIEGAGIARWRIAITSSEAAGYAIDNVIINEFDFNEPQGLVHNITQDAWYDDIQEAIGDANNGDELVAYPWHYCGGIDFGEKVVTLRSTDPEDPCVVAETIIDACGDWYAVVAGEDFELNGFTVTGGLYSGMHLYCSCGTIKNCVIEDNGNDGINQCFCGTPPSTCLVVEDCIIRSNDRDGIYTDFSTATIEECEIYNNGGEGIEAGYCSTATMSDNDIYDNGGDGIIIRGGCGSTATVKNNYVYDNYYGIYADEDSNSTITGNQIYDNTYCGIRTISGSTATISNNLVYSNTACGIWASSGSTISNNTIAKHVGGLVGGTEVYNCIFWDNSYIDFLSCNPTYSRVSDCNDVNETNHNICDDPCFVDADANDFHLSPNSPCIDTGDPNGDYEGQLDIDGQPRVLGEEVDMGADEFYIGPMVHNITQDTWYEGIGAAIGDANNGDELVAFPWVYGDINFGEKEVTVRSVDPEDPCVVATTVIDADGEWHAVEAGEGFELNGFTVTGALYSGMYLYCSCGTIKNCVIEDNGGWGIYQCYCGTPPSTCLVVEDCIIRGNDDSGIYTDYSTATIKRCEIYGNDEEGIDAGYYSTITMSDNVIYDNGADGIKTRSSSTATIQNSEIYSNGENGIKADDGATLTISNNKIYEHTRGIRAEGSSASIKNNFIYDNSIGIHTEEDSTSTIRNNMIYGNNAGIFINGSSATISNNTIVKNNGGIAGGANTEVYNCIFWDNSYTDLLGCSAIYSRISDCNDVNEANHNICDDPCFIDDTNDDYHLSPDSPCIDIGRPNWSYYGQTDIDGEVRVIGAYADIGADETDYHSVERLGKCILPTVSPDAHWWQLDDTTEGVTAYDSVGDSNGTFNGDDPCWVDGINGDAVDFNGANDYFSVSSLDSEYSNSDTFSVAGWFKTDQSAGIQTIVGQWSQMWEAGQEYFGWQVLVENNKVVARFGNGTTSDITGTADVNEGEWYHFAMVRNGTSTALYVDGQPEDSGTANFYPLNTKFRIGDGSYKFNGNPALKGGPFDGMIDDVMIFGSALSAGDVNDLYESGAPD